MQLFVKPVPKIIAALVCIALAMMGIAVIIAAFTFGAFTALVVLGILAAAAIIGAAVAVAFAFAQPKRTRWWHGM